MMWNSSDRTLLHSYKVSSHNAFSKLGDMDALMLLFAVRYPMIFPLLIIIGGVLEYSLKGEPLAKQLRRAVFLPE